LNTPNEKGGGGGPPPHIHTHAPYFRPNRAFTCAVTEIVWGVNSSVGAAAPPHSSSSWSAPSAWDAHSQTCPPRHRTIPPACARRCEPVPPLIRGPAGRHPRPLSFWPRPCLPAYSSATDFP